MNLSDTIGDCIYFRVKNIYTPNGLLHKTMCPVNDNATHHISAVCDILCDSYVVNELITQPAVSDEKFFYMYQFWLLLAFFVVCWVGQAVVVSIGDAICFELLGKYL